MRGFDSARVGTAAHQLHITRGRDRDESMKQRFREIYVCGSDLGEGLRSMCAPRRTHVCMCPRSNERSWLTLGTEPGAGPPTRAWAVAWPCPASVRQVLSKYDQQRANKECAVALCCGAGVRSSEEKTRWGGVGWSGKGKGATRQRQSSESLHHVPSSFNVTPG